MILKMVNTKMPRNSKAIPFIHPENLKIFLSKFIRAKKKQYMYYVIAPTGVIFGIYFTSCRYSGG